ncbi:hypothetical protein [Ancylobacter polymorphus]|uniref:Uncharacterized protein n=1 Tax=Ancylobacter polymorphus TaxID=223390 RepID=A0A9E6ZU28_9HYPH|nr:hypothetical protein [Ancylobacter polymorphus]UOK71744.1 hypothetical protein K9D25_03175 [Ancylobacter polymorphus]
MIYQPGPNILSMMRDEKVLGVECKPCWHRSVFTARQLIDHSAVGEMEGLERSVRRMRCALCGLKSADGTQLAADAVEGWLAAARR